MAITTADYHVLADNVTTAFGSSVGQGVDCANEAGTSTHFRQCQAAKVRNPDYKKEIHDE